MIAQYSVSLVKSSLKFFLDLDGDLVEHLMMQSLSKVLVLKADLLHHSSNAAGQSIKMPENRYENLAA